MGRRERAGCPSEDLLFRWSSGDESIRGHREIAAHVAACETCAARVRGWDVALDAYRGYDGLRGSAVSSAVIADDLAARARFEARLRREPRPSASAWPARDWMPSPRVRWLHAAAALLLVTIGMLWLRPAQATLSAEALIAGAIDREQQAPRETPRAGLVSIAANASSSSSAHGRSVAARGLHDATPPTQGTQAMRAMVADRGAEARELAQRLAMYQFDWQAPLSARPFQRWRASAASRADALEWVDSSLVRLSTSAHDGHVRRAELMLHMPDFHPVAQVWRFADGFEVELRLLERTPPSTPALLAAASISTIDPAVSGRDTSAAPWNVEDAELELRGGLERAGVRLGRRVTIRRGAATLVIEGRASSAALSRRIASVARDLPNVEARLRAGAGAGANAGAPAAAGAGGAALSTGMALWLDRTFAGSPLHDTFFARTRELEEELREAIAALDDFGARYPAAAAARLSPGSRRRFDRLAQAYFGRVGSTYERLEAHLAPLIGSVSRRVLPAQPPPDWRDSSSALAADLDRLSLALDATLAEPTADAEQFEAAARARVRPALAAVAPR